MYTFINDGIGYDIITDKKQFYELGSAFGDFQKMLNDFPIENLLKLSLTFIIQNTDLIIFLKIFN